MSSYTALPLQKDPVIRTLCGILSRSGRMAFLVGGSVRDLFLIPSCERLIEYDVVVEREPSAVCEELAHAIGGTFFPLDKRRGIYRLMAFPDRSIKAPFPKGHGFIERRGVQIDIASLRDGILADLARRDFTINAMAIPIEASGLNMAGLIDPFDGRRDIRACRLRAISKGIFDDDPVRLLRAYRISALLGLHIDGSTEALLRSKAHLLQEAPAERVRGEFFGVFASERAARWMEQILKAGLIPCLRGDGLETLEKADCLFSVIGNFRSIHKELVTHLNREVGGIPRYGYIKFATLLHDSDGDRLCKATTFFRLSRRAIGLLQSLLNAPMEVARLGRGRRAREAFFMDHGEDGVDLILYTSIIDPSLPMEEVEELLACYFSEYRICPPSPFLTGHDIMELLGIPPGREVGMVLKVLKEAEKEGRISTREEAIRFVEEVYRKGLTKEGQKV